MAWDRSTHVAAGILEGSEALECEFVEHFLPRLRTFFRARAGNPDWVDELTQETIVAALVALRGGGLREAGALEAFVLGIGRNQLAEAVRVRARERATATGETIELGGGSAALAPEMRLTVRSELAALDKTDRRILWLILVEGYRPAEVAGQVGLNEEAVRQRKSRLLRRLAEKINATAVTNGEEAATLQRRSRTGNMP